MIALEVNSQEVSLNVFASDLVDAQLLAPIGVFKDMPGEIREVRLTLTNEGM